MILTSIFVCRFSVDRTDKIKIFFVFAAAKDSDRYTILSNRPIFDSD